MGKGKRMEGERQPLLAPARKYFNLVMHCERYSSGSDDAMATATTKERRCCPLDGKDNNPSTGAFLSWRWHLPRAYSGITRVSRLLRDELR